MKLLSFDTSIQAIWRKISSISKTTFFSTFIIGLLAHMYMLTNFLPNHDTTALTSDLAYTVMHGRWFTQYATLISSTISLPWVNGLLSIFYIALAASLLVHLFQVQSTVIAVLIGGLMVTFPTVTSTLTYIMFSDAFLLCILISTLAIFITYKYKYGFLCGTILLTLCLGTYQAYFAYAAALSVTILIVALFHDYENIKHIFIKGAHLLFTLIGSLFFYFIILKITTKNIPLTSYMNIDKIGQLSLAEIPTLLGNAFKDSFRFFIRNTYGLHYSFLPLLFIIVFCILGYWCIHFIVQNKVYKNVVSFLLLFVLLLLFPLACGLVWLMNPPLVYLNMQFSLCLVPILALLLLDIMQENKADKSSVHLFITHLASWLISITTVICIFCYTITANRVYFKADITNKQATAYSIELTTRIESCDGYQVGMPVVFMGTPGDSIFNADFYGPMGGFPGTPDNLPATYSYSEYLRNITGATFSYIDITNEHYDTLSENPTFQNMPTYPNEGSIQIIDGWVVVKFEECLSEKAL